MDPSYSGFIKIPAGAAIITINFSIALLCVFLPSRYHIWSPAFTEWILNICRKLDCETIGYSIVGPDWFNRDGGRGNGNPIYTLNVKAGL